MVTCTKCGAELIGSRKFCAACGTPVKPPPSPDIVEVVQRVSTTSAGIGPDHALPPLVVPLDASGAGPTVPSPPPVFSEAPAPLAPVVVPPPEPPPMRPPAPIRPSSPEHKAVGPRGTVAVPQFQAAQSAVKPVVVQPNDQRGIDPFAVTFKPGQAAGTRSSSPHVPVSQSPVSPLASSALMPQVPPQSPPDPASPQVTAPVAPRGPAQATPYSQQAQPPPPQPPPYNYNPGYVQNAPVPPAPVAAGPAPGAQVWVTWSNGQRYPATVGQVSGTQCFVHFPDGQSRWVELAYVSAR